MHAPVYHARVTTNNMLLIPLGFVYCDLILTSRIFAAKTFSQIHYQIKSIIKSNPLSNQIHYQVKSIIKSLDSKRRAFFKSFLDQIRGDVEQYSLTETY